jgi:ribokinase
VTRADPPRIVVIGSANMDMVVQTEHIPIPGETVMGGEFVTVPGGKGANQAVAAARLGAQVHFIGRVGSDAFGEALTLALETAGVDTSLLVRDPDRPTGVALIGVAADGQNAIMVAPGANSRIGRDDVERARDVIANADILVAQLEIPMDTVVYAVETARSFKTRVLLNPAPIRHTDSLPDSLLRQVDALTPNEHEAVHLLGRASAEGTDFVRTARDLRRRGPDVVIVTLGADGCIVASSAGALRIEAPTVAAVDSTAAGDCFSGALAVALAEGRDIEAAARFATEAAALSVTRRGAQPSMPGRAEVDERVAARALK